MVSKDDARRAAEERKSTLRKGRIGRPLRPSPSTAKVARWKYGAKKRGSQ